jgi:hypothetical protein
VEPLFVTIKSTSFPQKENGKNMPDQAPRFIERERERERDREREGEREIRVI